MKAVIFDVDQVILNASEQEALSWREALRHFCQFVPLEFIRRKLNEHGANALKAYFSAKVLRPYREAFNRHVALVFADKYQPRIQVRPHMSDLLERLMAGDLLIGLISSSGQTMLRKNKRLAYLESLLNIKTRFVVQETELGQKEALLDTILALGVNDPTEVTVVCATPALASASQALQLNVIGLTIGGFTEAELCAAGCDDIFASTAALAHHFEKIGWLSPGSLTVRSSEERPTTELIRPMIVNPG